MRQFYAIAASLLLLAGLFLGCTKQVPQEAEKKQAKNEPPKVKVDPIVKDKGDPGQEKDKGKTPVNPPVNLGADKKEKYEAALDEAIQLLAERKWHDALTAFEAARAIDDTEFVQAEIARLKQTIDQDSVAKTTVKNIETVLNDGKADEAAKLAKDALKEFGAGDDAAKLVLLRLQADALQIVQQKDDQKEDKAARFNRYRDEAEMALKEKPKNLRAAVLAMELALQTRDDAVLQKTYDGLRDDLATYDAARKKAAELRRDPQQIDEALDALAKAAAVWDTPQVRAEIDECNLAKQKRRDTVSVANFEVRNDVGAADAGAVLAEELLSKLKTRFDVVERTQLKKVIDELNLERGFADDPKQQKQLGEFAKVRYLVIGSVSRKVEVTVRARLVDVRTGLIVQTAKIVGKDLAEVYSRIPDLARQLTMSDEDKTQFDAQLPAVKVDVAPDDFKVDAAPELPAADAPLPKPIIVNVAPPGFANMKKDAFKVLAPPPANFVAPEPEPLVLKQRRQLLFATLQMGDFLFRAGRFGEAQKQFEFALVLEPNDIAIQARVQQVRPFAPPVVVVGQQPVFYAKPRMVVLPFYTFGNPAAVPPYLSTWTPAALAPYFSTRYDVVDPAELYWYMGNLGLTIQDVMNDPNARRWLGRAVGVRYFVFGNCIETTSFDVNTYLIDVETGFQQGAATINVRNPFELKLRLAELAQLTMLTPEERAVYQAQLLQQRYVNLVSAGQRHMDEGNYREALREFGEALQIVPSNVQVQVWFQICQERVNFLDFELARRQRFEAQQAAVAAARQRQWQLAHDAELARRQAMAAAAARTPAQKQEHFLFRFQARDNMVTQAQFALKTNRFGISVNLFQGAMDIGAVVTPDVPAPTPVAPVVYQDFADARMKSERGVRLREAELIAARETTLRQERDKQLDDAKKQLDKERQDAKNTADAAVAAQAAKDEKAYDASFAQGKRLFQQKNYPGALAAFQAAQRFKQTEAVNKMIELMVDRQAETLGQTQASLDAERARREAAENLASLNEAKYKKALKAAKEALDAKDLDSAEAKYAEAKLIYKTDAVETGLRDVKSERAKLFAAKQKSADELKKADTIKQLIADGNAALDAKKFAEAMQSFQQAKQLAPDNLAVMTGLTRAEQANNRLLAEQRRLAEETGRTQTFQRLVKSGRDNLAAKQFEAAVANLGEALKLNPTDASVQADLKLAEKGRDASLTDAKALAAAKLRAESYQKLVSEGQLALDSKRFGDAIQKFTEAQKLLPGDKASQDYLKEALAAKKSAEDSALAAAKQRADDMKKAADLKTALTQGRTALAAKDFAGAEKLLNQAKALNPNDADVKQALRDLDLARQSAAAEVAAQKQRQVQFDTQLAAGKAALGAKKYAEALKALSSATGLMPDNKEAQDLYRRAQTEKSLADAAAVKDKTVVANYQAALGAGQKALQLKDFDGAIKSFQQALNLMPNDPTALKLLQQAQDAKGLAATTAANFQKAMDAGESAMTKKLYADAIKAFTEAKNLDPNDARARKLLQQAQQALADANQQALILANYQKAMTTGQTAMNAKNFAGAVSAFKEALKWMPNDQKAAQQLAVAQQLLQDSTKTKTPDPAKQYSDAMQRGATAGKDKRYADAVKAYTEALKLRPKDADALDGWRQNQFSLNLWQGQQYLDNAMWMGAQTEFEAALKLFPNNDQAKKLLQKAKNKMK